MSKDMEYSSKERMDALDKTCAKLSLGRQTYNVYPHYINNILKIKIACSKANAATGYLDEKVANAISLACEKIIEKPFPTHISTFIDAAPILNDKINFLIAEEATSIMQGEKISAEQVNLSQGARDIIATADMLFIYQQLSLVQQVLPKLYLSLEQKEEEFKDTFKMGRESLRDLLPIRLGQVYNSFRGQIEFVEKRLNAELNRYNTHALGGTYIGTGFGTLPNFKKYIDKELSCVFEREIVALPNMFSAVQGVSHWIGSHSILQELGIILARMGRDIIYMTSGPKCGLSDICIPAAQPGSSIMPGKINPVMPDLFVVVGHRIIANHSGIATAMFNGEMESGSDASTTRMQFNESAELLIKSIPLVCEKCIEGTVKGKSFGSDELNKSLRSVHLILRTIFDYEIAQRVCAKVKEGPHNTIQVLCDELNLTEQEAIEIFDPNILTDVQKSADLLARYA